MIIMDADFSHHVCAFGDAMQTILKFSVDNLAQVYPSVCSVSLRIASAHASNSILSGNNKNITLTLSQAPGTGPVLAQV